MGRKPTYIVYLTDKYLNIITKSNFKRIERKECIEKLYEVDSLDKAYMKVQLHEVTSDPEDDIRISDDILMDYISWETSRPNYELIEERKMKINRDFEEITFNNYFPNEVN